MQDIGVPGIVFQVWGPVG